MFHAKIFRYALVSTVALTGSLAAMPAAEACTCAPADLTSIYNSADEVVKARIFGRLNAPQGTKRYLAYVTDSFKGCLDSQFVIVETNKGGPACEQYLRMGGSYLLTGYGFSDAGLYPTFSVNSCGYNKPWFTVSPQDRYFLHTRDNCCGDDCQCNDGSEPYHCFYNPCDVTSCEGATQCVPNYCGGCFAEWYDDNGTLICD